jgi:hypothetical protein
MNLKTSIAALVVALAPAAVWAGAATDSAQNPQEAYKDGASVNAPSTDTGNATDEAAGWQYVNGQATLSDAQAEDSRNGMSETASADDPSANDQANDQTGNSDDAIGNDFYANLDSSRDDAQLSGDSATGRLSGRLEDVIGNTSDKVVIILPVGWQGSIADLVAALERTSDAEILVLKPDGQQADMSSDGTENEETPDSQQ